MSRHRRQVLDAGDGDVAKHLAFREMDRGVVGELIIDIGNTDYTGAEHANFIRQMLRRDGGTINFERFSTMGNRDIPFLRKPTNTMYYIDLVIQDGSSRLGIRLVEHSLYLVGFRPNNQGPWYSLDGWEEERVVDNHQMTPSGIPCDYGQLGAKKTRTGHLGRQCLINAVHSLNSYNEVVKKDGMNGGLFAIAQMVCEPMRFPEILNYTSDHKFEGFNFPANLVALQNDFEKESKYFTGNSIRERLMNIQMTEPEFNRISTLLQLPKREMKYKVEGGMYKVADQFIVPSNRDIFSRPR